MSLSEVKHLVKHSSIYGLANILGKGIGFIMIPVYTRYILPADYGLLELLDTSINIISMFLGIGLTAAVTRFYMHYEDTTRKNTVISTSILFFDVLMSILLILSFSISKIFARFILGNASYSYYTLLSLVTLSFTLILEIPITYIVARQKSVIFTLVSTVRLFFALSLNIYFVVFLQIGILGILYSGLITTVLFTLALSVWTLKQVGLKFDYVLLKEMVTFGAPLILNRIGMFVINFGDRFFLRKFVGYQQLGLYALGYKFGFMISFLIGNPFFKIWSVRQYSIIKEEDGKKKFAEVFDLYALFLFWAWLMLSVFSPEIVYIVAAREYYNAYKIIPIVALGYVFREHSDFFKGVFYIEKNTKVLGILTITVAIFCLITYIICIPLWGTMGAAYASLLTFMFMAALNYYFANRLCKIPYNFRLYFITLFLSISLWGIASNLMLFTDTRMLLLLKIMIIVLFPIMLFNFLSSDEKKRIILVKNQILQKVLHKGN